MFSFLIDTFTNNVTVYWVRFSFLAQQLEHVQTDTSANSDGNCHKLPIYILPLELSLTILI